MSEEDGGVEESINSSARIALTVAIQLGEKLARAYQEAMREAQHRDAVVARELAARFDAERASARQAVNVVNDPQWWDKASLRDVACVAETAAAWKSMDPQVRPCGCGDRHGGGRAVRHRCQHPDRHRSRRAERFGTCEGVGGVVDAGLLPPR